MSEFGCTNGSCISLEKRCDGVADCDDKFDEMNCAVVIIDRDLYQKNRPPGITETLQTNVDIGFEIISIDYFDEIEMKFSIKFKVELKWCV
jgi:hypothetical protein